MAQKKLILKNKYTFTNLQNKKIPDGIVFLTSKILHRENSVFVQHPHIFMLNKSNQITATVLTSNKNFTKISDINYLKQNKNQYIAIKQFPQKIENILPNIKFSYLFDKNESLILSVLYSHLFCQEFEKRKAIQFFNSKIFSNNNNSSNILLSDSINTLYNNGNRIITNSLNNSLYLSNNKYETNVNNLNSYLLSKNVTNFEFINNSYIINKNIIWTQANAIDMFLKKIEEAQILNNYLTNNKNKNNIDDFL